MKKFVLGLFAVFALSAVTPAFAGDDKGGVKKEEKKPAKKPAKKGAKKAEDKKSD